MIFLVSLICRYTLFAILIMIIHILKFAHGDSIFYQRFYLRYKIKVSCFILIILSQIINVILLNNFKYLDATELRQQNDVISFHTSYNSKSD